MFGFFHRFYCQDIRNAYENLRAQKLHSITYDSIAKCLGLPIPILISAVNGLYTQVHLNID